MPDCWLKYKIIVERSKQNYPRFKDAQFTPSDNSLGDGVLENFPNQRIQWKCFSDNNGLFNGHNRKWKNKRYSIFKDGVDVNDIQ